MQLPISYGDAKPLLEALAGPVAPKDFQVGLVEHPATHAADT